MKDFFNWFENIGTLIIGILFVIGFVCGTIGVIVLKIKHKKRWIGQGYGEK